MRNTVFMILALVASAGLEAAEPLATETAVYEKRAREYRLGGVVEALHRSTVSAQTQGQALEVTFDVDDFVEQGAVIVRLNDSQHRSRLNQAEAELDAAAARLQEARDEYQRIKGVFERDLASQAEMDRVSSGLKSARAQKNAAEAAVAQAREQLEYTVIRAPFAGIVTERHIERGEMANPGQPIMSGLSLESLRVAAEVPQSLIPYIREHREAWVAVPDHDPIKARDLTIFPYANPGAHTFEVRLDLPANTPVLVPGMYVKTTFTIGTEDFLLIPARAVVYRSEVTGAYVVEADAGIRFRHLRLGGEMGSDRVVVRAGLDEGERVALDPIAAGVRLKAQRDTEAGHE